MNETKVFLGSLTSVGSFVALIAFSWGHSSYEEFLQKDPTLWIWVILVQLTLTCVSGVSAAMVYVEIDS